ncbi:MAG: hypothetical protein SFX18_01915 [Pirellulales bacterium]|nr:hypothetical protein [Pirellulales bacterium]
MALSVPLGRRTPAANHLVALAVPACPPLTRGRRQDLSPLCPFAAPSRATFGADAAPWPNSWEIVPPAWPLGERLIWLLLGAAPPAPEYAVGKVSRSPAVTATVAEEDEPGTESTPREDEFDDEWEETVDDEEAYSANDADYGSAAAGYARTAALAWIEEDWEEPEESLPEECDYWLPEGDTWD